MTRLRTTRSSVTFDAPFKLKSFDEPRPAGTYEVDTYEEIIQGNARTVYRRVATLLYLRSSGMTRNVAVDPNELQDALARDRER